MDGLVESTNEVSGSQGELSDEQLIGLADRLMALGTKFRASLGDVPWLDGISRLQDREVAAVVEASVCSLRGQIRDWYEEHELCVGTLDEVRDEMQPGLPGISSEREVSYWLTAEQVMDVIFGVDTFMAGECRGYLRLQLFFSSITEDEFPNWFFDQDG